ncbi:hypothetical protein KK062_18870 [Fulvivirgaceae bacterium PWU5]|uniref:Uncharacterized protein n=1 Tax=Dawidia cretensis TaxID=2782350 RepID=A0AAP2E2D3_9BACT|nr:hypothetical protein [Dawidia cretensis]
MFFRRYQIWVINTPSEALLYTWEKWKTLLPFVDAIVNLSVKPAFIRTAQSYETENRLLGFGRMKWSEENNHKWTTKHRKNAVPGKKLTFFNTEIWAPDWTTFNGSTPSPDVYIRLYQYENIDFLREGLIIALRRSIEKDNRLVINSALKDLQRNIPGSSISTTTRTWTPWFRFLNNIEDMGPWELTKIVTKYPISLP